MSIESKLLRMTEDEMLFINTVRRFSEVMPKSSPETFLHLVLKGHGGFQKLSFLRKLNLNAG